MTAQVKTYHHGDLRNALIVAAAELIEENNNLDFPIKEAAKRAGVSTAAPYRHFKDKEDWLRSVRELAFLGLHIAISDAIERAGADSLNALAEIGRAYIDYARKKHAFFNLMWEDRGDINERREEMNLKKTGFELLVDSVAGACNEHPSICSADPVRLATLLWSVAHGIATLEINHMLNLFDSSVTAESLIETATKALMRNHDALRL